VKKSLVAQVLIVTLLVVVGGGLALWKYRSIKAAGAGGMAFEPAEAVEVVAARPVKWQPTAQLSGTAIALQSVTLSNEVAGTIREVRFESGSIVEQGQVLLTLDTTTQEAERRALEASVRVMDAAIALAEAEQRVAEANLRRVTLAVESRAVSESELDQARSRLDAATAQLARSKAERQQAQARVEQMNSMIDKMTLKAPFRAIAGLRNVHPGQYLAEGASVVGLQSVSDTIYVDFALPQEHASRVKKGDVVMARAPMISPEPVRIEIAALDAVANSTTRNVRVRAIVPNPEQKLRPGMFVDVVAPTGPEQEFIAIPLTAVGRASFGDHVFVIGPDESDPAKLRAYHRPVRLGPSIGQSGDVIVLEGLKAGEEVAASGRFKLRDKALVIRGQGTPSGEGRVEGVQAAGR
jgi:membrane fusion protein (multidrug efflux system)